jgi:spermidine synthase
MEARRKSEANFSLNLILVIIFIEGFITLSAQVITLRQLIPFVGNTIVVTGTVIAFFLLFLAIGYKKGGEYLDNYLQRLKVNFLYSSFLAGVGLSYLFIEIFFDIALHISTPRVVILILYLLLITSPMVYLLGQTIPIATNLIKGSRVGEISGNALFISTIGSFLGSIVTVVILFNWVGVAYTVFINFLLLSSLVVALAKNNRNERNTKLAVILFTIVTFTCNVGFEKFAFSKTNLYGNYSFEKFDMRTLTGGEIPNPGRVLAMNRGYQSFLNDKNEGFPYLEFIKRVLFKDLKLKNKKILVLGAGGFSLSAAGDYQNEITYVDIDPGIHKLVKDNYLKDIKGSFIARDARLYIKESQKIYDVILTDTFSNSLSLPFHLVTIEHLRNIRKRLSKNGIAIFNIIGDASFNDLYTKRIDNTLRLTFGNCLSNPLEYNPQKRTNIVYICNKNQTARDNVFYTDNKNNSAIDFFD